MCVLNREREGDLGVPSPWVDELDPEAMVAEAVVQWCFLSLGANPRSERGMSVGFGYARSTS